jgi:hypothetical protein
MGSVAGSRSLRVGRARGFVAQFGALALSASVVCACSSSSGTPNRGTNGAGASTGTGTGGAFAAGGSSSTGGAPQSASGGSGVVSSGGNAAAGASAAATGGSEAMGGATSIGGSSAAAGGTGVALGQGGSPAGGAAGATSTMPCQMASYTFEPKIPTVFLLVDRSGSMFGCRTKGGANDATGRECADPMDTAWYPLRDGVLTVVKQLQADVRFGFSDFTGEQGDAMCGTLQAVNPDLNNYQAIADKYNALKAPQKGETPTRKALEQVEAVLRADDSPGDRFILFVTDGQPDYCDDGNNLCPPDSVVGELQTLAADGIKTLVFGISTPLTTISDSVLQAFANAGDAQPVAPPGTNDPTAFYDQCNNVADWRADFVATGKTDMRGESIGTYSDMAGTAPVFKPDLSNQSALVDLFSQQISNLKSCTFDLSNVNGQSIKVDLNQLDQASISIMGTAIPLDETNGWSMASATQLVLNGTSCDTWRMPEVNDIDFNFPCKTIIFE